MLSYRDAAQAAIGSRHHSAMLLNGGEHENADDPTHFC
jgi:hypothetical protein